MDGGLGCLIAALPDPNRFPGRVGRAGDLVSAIGVVPHQRSGGLDQLARGAVVFGELNLPEASIHPSQVVKNLRSRASEGEDGLVIVSYASQPTLGGE